MAFADTQLDLALIPARGGSVGLPGKNIKPLGGVPLIGWTIAAALVSGCFKRVVVSTDDEEIAAAARASGAEVPFMRPDELASSTAGSLEVVEHALSTLEVGGPFALLQPTSPFRSARHIRSAAQQFTQGSADALVAVSAGKPLAWSYQMDSQGKLSPALVGEQAPSRRQDAAEVVQPNGAMYITSPQALRDSRGFIPPQTKGFVMGKIDSLDIDDAEDFAFAEALVAAGKRAIDR